jgi:hypothetical protein
MLQAWQPTHLRRSISIPNWAALSVDADALAIPVAATAVPVKPVATVFKNSLRFDPAASFCSSSLVMVLSVFAGISFVV